MKEEERGSYFHLIHVEVHTTGEKSGLVGKPAIPRGRVKYCYKGSIM